MKILVVCQYYYPEQFRINDICEQLVAEGHTVTVLTGLPNYPKGEIPFEYKWGKRRKEVINGVKIFRSYEIARGNSVFKLILNYLSYMISASIRIIFIKKDFDLIFAYQLSPVTMAIPAIIAKKITKIPLYLYSCDIWPESIKNIISDEESIIYRLLKNISSYIYKQSDGIGITSTPFYYYFNKVHSIPIDKINYIPQHAEEIYLSINEPVNNGIIDFVFMGNIGLAQDIDCILNAVQELQKYYDFKVHFVGDGSYLENCKLIVHEKRLSNYVVFHGQHPIEEMSKFYMLADACLLTLKGDSYVSQTMPSKLQGYMAAGRTVLGAINGAAQEVIKESQCGSCVNAGDYKALAELMRDFIDNPHKYKEKGENGRKYFMNNFTKEKYMEKLLIQFYKLTEENNYV